MVVQLGVEELRQGRDAFHLGLFDVLHTADHVLAGLLKLGLVHSDLLLDSEVVSSGLAQLTGAGVVGQASVLELLASSLWWS